MEDRKILDQFRVRDETHRAKLVSFLALNFGKQVPQPVAIDAVYGKRKGSSAAFAKVISSINRIIKERKLPYEIVEQKRQKGKTVGLYNIEKETPVVTQRATLAAINSKGWFQDDDK